MSGLISKRRPFISSLTGIKVGCLLLIFWWHTTLEHPPINLGARCCEILYIVSGFTVAYNYKNNDEISLPKQCWSFFASRLKKFFPLHLLTFIVFAFIEKQNGSISTFITNLLLLNSWTNDLGYNTLSWFISALLFCYLLSPLFIKLVNKYEDKKTILLISVIALRYFSELILVMIFKSINMHIFPITHAMEFLLGMIVEKYYELYKDKEYKYLYISIIEIVLFVLYILVCVFKDNIWPFQTGTVWPRSMFVFAFLPLLFVISLNKGLLSKLLSLMIFEEFNKIQFEFYMIHNIMIHIMSFYVPISNYLLAMIIAFALSIVFSILIKKASKLIIKRS